MINDNHSFEPWDGSEYLKEPYDVLIFGGEVVRCYPNDGKMLEIEGRGRTFRPSEIIGIQLVGWDRHMHQRVDFLEDNKDRRLEDLIEARQGVQSNCLKDAHSAIQDMRDLIDEIRKLRSEIEIYKPAWILQEIRVGRLK